MQNIQNLFSSQSIILLVVRVFVILCCFPVHECAHAWVADRLGDHTGRMQGRITLNPLKHLDLWGTLTIFLFGVGYAKPVPVSLQNFRNPKRDFALTALAGPVSNLLMAIFFLVTGRFVSGGTSNVVCILDRCLVYAAYINISLAVFNLIPVPPLDGSRVLAAVLPDRAYEAVLKNERYSMYILLGLLLVFSRIGFSPISVISGVVFNFLCRILG